MILGRARMEVVVWNAGSCVACMISSVITILISTAQSRVTMYSL